MSKEFKADCGCEIHIIKWSSKREVASVKHCPLHKAAPELLTALKAVLRFAIETWESEFQTSDDHHCNASAVKQAQAIIARIEGRS